MLWKSRWQKLAWMSAIATLVVGSFFVAHNVSWHDPQQRAVYTTQDSIGAVAINPDQTRIAADSTNGSITIWRRDTGMIVQSWVAANTKITELHFRPDSYSLVVGSEDSAVRLWDSASGQLLRTFGDAPNSVQPNSANRDSSFQTLPPSGIHALALSPDDRLIAVGGEQGRINVFALNTGAVMLRLRGHAILDNPGYAAGVVRVAFSSTGQYLASSAEDGSISVWDIKTGQNIAAFGENYRYSPSKLLAFLADGHTILAVGGISIAYETRDMLSRNIVRKGEIPALNGAIVLAPDRMTYARGGENRSGYSGVLPIGNTVDTHIYIEQLTQGQPIPIRRLTGHHDWVTSLAISQDGTLLVSGSSDRTVRTWNIEP